MSTTYGTPQPSPALYPPTPGTILWENDEAKSQREWDARYLVEYYDYESSSWKVEGGYSYLEDAIRSAKRQGDEYFNDTHGDRLPLRVISADTGAH
jgi:hypothetical protein